jgi:hypothetical protein
MNRRSFINSLAVAPLAALARTHSQFLNFVAGVIPISSRYSASMWTYLWDLVDEGYDNVLRNLAENKLTSISLATAYHAGKLLEPHNPKRRVVFLEDGTVYFRPNSKIYGRIHPKVNSLVSSGHGLEKVKIAADRMGLHTRAWVVCCHNTPMGMTYPDITNEDAFGDKLYHNLCPSNEDVRRYIRSLVADIASHRVDTIELEALEFQEYSHGFHHEMEAIELNPTAKFLLSVCFCPACFKRAKSADVDLVPIRAFVRTTLEAWFTDPEATAQKYPDLDRLPSDLFEPMLAWRETVVSSFLEEVEESAGVTKVRQMAQIDPVARRLTGINPAASAKVAGGVLVLGYVKDGLTLRAPLQDVQNLIGTGEITLGLQVGLPESGGKKEFLQKISVAEQLGIRSFNFYNYGLIPRHNLTWIRDAFAN